MKIQVLGLWHVNDGNRIYIHKRLNAKDYNNFYTSIGDFGYTIPGSDAPQYNIESDSEHYLNFGIAHINFNNGTNNQITNPNPEVYTRFYIQMKTPDGQDRIVYEAENANAISFLIRSTYHKPMSGLVGGFRFDPLLGIRVYKDSFVLADELARIQSEFTTVYGNSGINVTENTTNYSVRMYWESAVVVEPGEPSPENPIPWLSNLPNITDGNPENIDGQWGNVTGFNYNPTTKLFNADVIYDGNSYPIRDAVVASNDDSFLTRTEKSVLLHSRWTKVLISQFQ